MAGSNLLNTATVFRLPQKEPGRRCMRSGPTPALQRGVFKTLLASFYRAAWNADAVLR